MKLLQVEMVKRQPLISAVEMAEYSVAIILLSLAALSVMVVGHVIAWIVL